MRSCGTCLPDMEAFFLAQEILLSKYVASITTQEISIMHKSFKNVCWKFQEK